MRFDPEDPTYKRLLCRVLRSDGRVVPFVGAGLSAYGEEGKRLPLWGELLERLVDEGVELGLIDEEERLAIAEVLEDEGYIEATDLILYVLGEPTFRRTVERELDETGKEIPPAVTELVSIDWPLIVTTNLDRMISNAYLERRGERMPTVTNQDLGRLSDATSGALRSSGTTLAKIHGDIDSYPSWILTKAHYDQLLQAPGYVAALQTLFLSQVFFVGFGLQDDDFDLVLKTIAEIYPEGAGEIYALIGRSRKGNEVINELITKNLQPIYYDDSNPVAPSDPFGRHRAVYECLAHMAASWAVARSGLDVTMKYFPELDPYMVRREDETKRLANAVEAGGIVQVVGLGGSGKTSMLQQFLHDHRLEIAMAGYVSIFGCSLYRADIDQFIADFALATVGPATEPLQQRVENVCRHVQAHQTLLLLDGAEVVLDEEGKLRSPYLLQILHSVLRGGGLVLLTSRIPVRGELGDRSEPIDVSPLTSAEIDDFLEFWGLGNLPDAARHRLAEVTAGHPLALRVLAGLLLDVPERDAVSTIERSKAIAVSDEVDPLRENRLARVVGSYLRHLGPAELAFLICASAFEGPVPFPLVETTLTRSYPDTAVNSELVGRDLRPVIEKLIRRRLLTVSAATELSSHPSVREYFERRAAIGTESLVPIHRFLAAEHLRDTTDLPETFEEARPLIVAARHAAAASDWTLFDDLVRNRLLRGPRHYLCNTLGAWEEGLTLARLGHETSFPSETVPEPAYYPAAVARCLKHLGRSEESRAVYRQVLAAACHAHDPNTAKYVNNFLTLLISRGELARADRLVELNVRALAWTDEGWTYCWQLEHGFASIAYLRMLQGDAEEALRLLDLAERAWDEHPGGPLKLFSHYPYHRAEVVLLLDESGHEAALEAVWDLLSVALDESWPESVCRGHVQAARVYLDRAECQRSWTDLADADRHLREAGEVAAGMVIPEVEIRYLLAQVRRYLVSFHLDGPADSDHVELSDLVARLEQRVEISGLELFAPEAIAAWGALAHLRESPGEARQYYLDAVSRACDQGNAHVGLSRRSVVHWLGAQLGPEAVPPPTWTTDPSEILGSGLTSDQMTDHLAFALAAVS
jgi:tetratricopeptide (TPR) repeat protein